jgi:hypothetical protein
VVDCRKTNNSWSSSSPDLKLIRATEAGRAPLVNLRLRRIVVCSHYCPGQVPWNRAAERVRPPLTRTLSEHDRVELFGIVAQSGW